MQRLTLSSHQKEATKRKSITQRNLGAFAISDKYPIDFLAILFDDNGFPELNHGQGFSKLVEFVFFYSGKGEFGHQTPMAFLEDGRIEVADPG